LTYENLGPLGGPNSGTKAVWNNGEHGAVLGGVLGPYPAPVARTKRHYNAMGSGEKGFSGEEKGRRKHGQHEET